jgi:hypothetical protein
LGRNERAGFEIRVLECAVEPNADLPDDFEHRQGGAVIAGERVVGGISRAADFAEELVNFVGENAVVAQATEEFVLTIFWPIQDTDVGCDKLGEDFRELPQLEETGVWIVGEIAFCKHPKVEKLLVVEL